MPEIVFGGNIRIRVTPQGKNVLNSFAFKDSGELVDLFSVVMQACKMYHRFDLVIVLDLFRLEEILLGNGTLDNGVSRNQYFKCLIDIVEFGILFRRKDLKRETSFLLVNL